MTNDTNKIFDPQFGWYEKIDVLKDAPQFSGTPKDIISLYLHIIKVYKKNLGKLTIYDTIISVIGINKMTLRVKELTLKYRNKVQMRNELKLNKIAEKHWIKCHTLNTVVTTNK